MINHRTLKCSLTEVHDENRMTTNCRGIKIFPILYDHLVQNTIAQNVEIEKVIAERVFLFFVFPGTLLWYSIKTKKAFPVAVSI